MSLFTKRVKEKKSTLEYYVDAENVTEDEFNRYKDWIAENIPSTERYTPTWKPSDDMSLASFANLVGGSNGNNRVQPPAPNPMGPIIMEKLKFRFKHEEHAMAFKLII